MADASATHAARNALHTALLLGTMFALFAAFGWFLFGGLSGVLMLGFFGLASAALGARVSPGLVLRMYRAQPLAPTQSPRLFAMLEEIARAAELPAVPRPYYVPSRMVNAFAVGSPGRAALGITDGLLRTLSAREVRGVLAHEVAHIAHDDAWVMNLADFVTRTVNTLSWFGQIMLILYLPSVLTGARPPYSFSFVLLLVAAPTASAFLQLALSRTREYDADLGAARLTGDPRGLASALAKMERLQGGMFERIFMPGRRVPEPSLLRTHPPTEERVRRLLEIERDLGAAATVAEGPVIASMPFRQPARDPRWHVTGFWY